MHKYHSIQADLIASDIIQVVSIFFIIIHAVLIIFLIIHANRGFVHKIVGRVFFEIY